MGWRKFEEIEFDGQSYRWDTLSDEDERVLDLLWYSRKKAKELRNKKVTLTAARNTHIDNLKSEILKVKSGLSFNDS